VDRRLRPPALQGDEVTSPTRCPRRAAC
jgi:hypothetical protein